MQIICKLYAHVCLAKQDSLGKSGLKSNHKIEIISQKVDMAQPCLTQCSKTNSKCGLTSGPNLLGIKGWCIYKHKGELL